MRRAFILISVLLGFASCVNQEHGKVYEPAVRVEVREVEATRASFALKTIQAASVRYGTGTSDQPEFTSSIETASLGSVDLSIELSGLEPDTEYRLRVQGIGPGGEQGKEQSLDFHTVPAPSQMYPWEKGRASIPRFADISLVTLGQHNSNPPAWTKERFASHVYFTDEANVPHWLFDAFLCIDGYDGKRGLSYSITNGRQSAGKESWEDLLDAWLGEDGALLRLDEAVSDAASLIGAPPRLRYVVMSLPDPIMYQYFDNKQSSTTYWGELDGRQLDFSRVEDQMMVYRWYMNRCRARFNALQFKHLELVGFYILSEELPLSPDFFRQYSQTFDSADTWNWQSKRWEQLVPYVSSYAHSCNEGLWWIPYHLAPGYKVWKELGFDAAFMQPNRYWDNGSTVHPMSKTVEAIQKYKMGMELEFEYSLVAEVMQDGRAAPDGAGRPTFYLKDVPLLRERVREYLSAYKDSGLYGQQPLAVYSGTDAMHQLATSSDSGDRAMFLELCHYICDSPLKK